jgi:predicted DNA-binding transcriptional regulator YafY
MEDPGSAPASRDAVLAGLVARLLRGEAVTTAEVSAAAGVERRAAVRWRQRLRAALPGLVERRIGRQAALILPSADPDGARLAEAIGLRLAVDALRALDGTPWHAAIVRLAAAREADIADLGHLVGELERGWAFVGGGRPARDCAPVLAALTDAWRQRRWIVLRYRTLDGRDATRRAQVWGLLLRREQVLLVAAHRHRGRMVPRQYRVEDVHEVVVQPARHARPRAFNARAWLDGRWGSYVVPDAPPEEVVVDVRGEVAGLVRPLALHPSQRIVGEADGWLRVAWTVVPCPELEARLLGWIPDVRVVAPEGLRERLAARVAAWRGGAL